MPADGCSRVLLSFFLHALLILPSSSQDFDNDVLGAMIGPLTRVPVVTGRDVDMPCESRSLIQNDTLLLVVWYRKEAPVYSYDARKKGPTAHWIEEILSGRAQWMNWPVSALHLKDVQPQDRAMYRCRVDFQLSQTKNYRVALDVIELPSKPVIFDDHNKEITGVAGPYSEGSSFKLICSVNGGVPTPRVRWLAGDTVLPAVGVGDIQLSAGSKTLTLSIKNATRNLLAATFTCTANNTRLAPPQRTTVQLDLYLKPLTVEILSREQPLSVGRKGELWCKSTGARPPATITWWLGSTLLDSVTKHKDLEDRNETLSMLEWMPLKKHNGQVLTCRAEQPKINGSIIETKLLLNIYYMPETTMHLGAKMNPNDIEEGDDVYFGCVVDAYPPAYKVVWEHNGVILQHNPSNGVIISGNSNLALRNISRYQAGNYTCTASNVEGDGKSPPVQMRIVYKPMCRNRVMKLIGAPLQEQANIACEVDAFPPPDTFEWVLNSSLGSIKVDSERFTIEAKEGKSVLTYTPISDGDYGTLSCRATNLAGRQVAPCVYTLLPANRPDPPTNCTVYNLTDDALDLTCLPGYDGGLQNVYLAEVWANEGLVVNSSNGIAVWNLRRLGAKRRLRLVVYAANARGRSENVKFVVKTASKQSPRTEAQEAWEMNWAVGGVLGAALTITVILCLAFIATRLRRRSRDYEVATQSTKAQKSLQKRASPDDCNPDLIPPSKAAECQPEPPLYAAVVARPESKNTSTHSLARTQSPTSPLSSHPPHFETQSARSCVNGAMKSHREIVTTRTPLLSGHQESCV
ncbi:neural cell adhesion molecule 2-like isoform X2 [Epargyreus clarus]|uniref:neural cell adhesion molecule 2-like isoform X2 n=1 Tax=Epargyreus clarus TaxID=520877 RepID=UPI003C2F4732